MPVKTTRHEKSKFAVVLGCMADGTKLKSMVVFKRKTLTKKTFSKGVLIHVHPKGRMNEDGYKLWINQVRIDLSGG